MAAKVERNPEREKARGPLTKRNLKDVELGDLYAQSRSVQRMRR
jgi:hypothetical protein